jgi:hypothetical protein
MSDSDLNATLEIRSGFQGGTEPWRQTVTLGVDRNGFRDVQGIGRSGDDVQALEISTVRESLLKTFDRAELCELLDQLVRLREALSSSSER